MTDVRATPRSRAARALRAALAVAAASVLLAAPLAAGLPVTALVLPGSGGMDTMPACGGACPLMAAASCEMGEMTMDCCGTDNSEQHPGQAASTPSGPQLAAPVASGPVASITLHSDGLAAGTTGWLPLPAGTPLYTLHSSLLN